ncbi:MAG: domain S-box protein [Frankiales bacterium]|nr:domain S-box protein [Frankiales bacterium]
MDALRRLVLAVALVGLLAQVLVGVLLHDVGPIASALTGPDHLGGLPPHVLLLGLLLLTVAGDLISVPVRRGEQTEELTLYEATVVVAVLLLPARDALWVPVAALALTSLVQRRDPVKSVFNIGNQAAATACLVGVVHLVSGPGEDLSWHTVVALVVGLLAFSATVLVGLTRVLALVGEDDATHVLRDGSRLALVTAVATVAMAGGGVLAAMHAPALLPFSLVPAVALLFAFRATAQAAEQRQRSSRLLALSHVLAGRVDPDEMLPAFLSQCRQAFGAEVAQALLDPAAPGGAAMTAVDDQHAGGERRASTVEELAVLRVAGVDARALSAPLPHGWTSALVAPLEADGLPLGVLVLATRDRHHPLGAADLVLHSPLATALAVALRSAAHLRRLTEATSKLQAVVDQSSDGILVLDGTGTVQLWSPALGALTGRHETEAVGRALPSLVTVQGADDGALDAFQAGASLLTPASPQATVELTLRRDDGEQRVVRCAHAGVFVDGALDRDVVIVHDVTRERQVERLKADFIATVSHELRTPVTPIKGYADLLRRKGDALGPEKRSEYLAIISDRCDHLARLVEDLLLASRISATEGHTPAQVSMGSDDLVGLVRRAGGDFGDEGGRLALVLPAHPVPVACDPVRAVQVLTNLVGNALKYSPPGSPVEVRLGVEHGRAHVDVVDGGRGIPADQLERVFEKFHRVEDSMRMTTGGTGLGLYIARQLSTAMGGTLRCTSTLGVGSTFRFTLPLATVPPAASPGPPGRPAPALTAMAPLPRSSATPPRSEHAAASQPL